MSDEKSANNLRSNGKDLSDELHGRFRSCVFWAWLCRRARRLSSIWRCRLHHLLQREVACVFLRAAPAALEVRPAARRGVLRRGKGSQARCNHQPRRPLRLGARPRTGRSAASLLPAVRIESYSFPPRSSPLTFQQNAVICYAAMESVASAIAFTSVSRMGRQFGEGH